MKLLILFCFVIGCVVTQKACTEKEIAIFKKWQKEFNKPTFDKSLEASKCLQLLKAIEAVKKNNADPKNHRSGLNEMSDMTDDEFRSRRFGIKIPDSYKHIPGPHTE